MKRITYWAATAAITGVGLVGCNRSDQNKQSANANPPGQSTANAVQHAADKTGDALSTAAHDTGKALGNATTRASELAQRAGSSISPSTKPSNVTSAPDSKSIQSQLATVVNDAVSKNSFGSFTRDFTEAGRKQMGDHSKLDVTTLNGIISQIQSDWKAKYGNDFKAPSNAFAIDSFEISEEVVSNGNTVVSSSMARLTLATRGNGPGLTIPLKKEGMLGSWRIDPPTSLTAQKLLEDLSSQLTAVKDAKAKWPSDENAAYRLVAHHVLAACMDHAGHAAS